MNEEPGKCRYEMVYTLQFQNLREDLGEIKERVRRLEATLARGVLLLIGNLAGMIVMLAQQLFKK
ncbi:MAG: hypothetical protein NTZ09_20000 [Candidatus Hydrogenedentes bacterium]|nr:hypothetical protein [Candidatus Hydrogenedentota bacterium]